jgi:hypothetical protein
MYKGGGGGGGLKKKKKNKKLKNLLKPKKTGGCKCPTTENF